MIDRFAQFPESLRSKTRSTYLGPTRIPALLAHPDWESPSPVVIWLHGRTVNKELDSGRYLRWIRAGIAAVAVDLPGHGERLDNEMQHPSRSLDVVAQMVSEVDSITTALACPEYSRVFDSARLGIGGMSAGGMAALRRLCDPHPFTCATVEGTTGWLSGLYLDDEHSGENEVRTKAPWAVSQDPAKVKDLDPLAHLGGWQPIPLLALHSEADTVIPVAGMRRFIEALQRRYSQQGSSAAVILQTWPQTGAPSEHAGFGKVANEAKSLQVNFLSEHLRPAIHSG